MKIPPEFSELCQYFDPWIIDAFPEEKDVFIFALKQVNSQQQRVVKDFIVNVLENVHDSEELNRIWRAAKSNALFESDSDLRFFLEELVRRIDHQ